MRALVVISAGALLSVGAVNAAQRPLTAVAPDSVVVTIDLGRDRAGGSELRRVILHEAAGIARRITSATFDARGDTLSLALPAVIRFVKLPPELTVVMPNADPALLVRIDVFGVGKGTVRCSAEGRHFEYVTFPEGGFGHRVDQARPLACTSTP